jgi:hypothetical protein
MRLFYVELLLCIIIFKKPVKLMELCSNFTGEAKMKANTKRGVSAIVTGSGNRNASSDEFIEKRFEIKHLWNTRMN